jgi:hypothetical protein
MNDSKKMCEKKNIESDNYELYITLALAKAIKNFASARIKLKPISNFND